MGKPPETVETELEMALRHVANAEIIIARQKEIVARIRHAGGNVAMAEELLAQFEGSLAAFLSHRTLIYRELSGDLAISL